MVSNQILQKTIDSVKSITGSELALLDQNGSVVVRTFTDGTVDVLVCTSIIESGLDFPNVNTIVVDQAQMFGLGQLYQMRGRVGRSDRQAFAYLVVPDAEHLSPLAGERLKVLQNMDYLGAGFQLAMEDLRLRGAGNILGEVQSGHMNRVGLDLYLEMLENTYFWRFFPKTFGCYRKKSYLCTRKTKITSRSGAVGSSPGS